MAKKRKGNSEGSIWQRKDSRWVAAITADNGKRISRYAKTRAEAHKKLQVLLSEQQRGLESNTSRQTMGDFLVEWLESRRNSLRSTTFARYVELIHIHTIPEIGRIKLSKLQPRHLEKLYTKKLESGLSPTTVRHIHARIHTALEQAMRRGLVFRNVAGLVTPPKRAFREMLFLTPVEARKVLSAAQGDRLESLYILALTSGLRKGELLGLSWNNIDLDNHKLRVEVALLTDNTLAPPKTAKGRRVLSLTKLAVDSLRKRKIVQIEEQLLAGSAWRNQRNLVFTNSVGSHLNPSHLSGRLFPALLRRAQVKRIRFHDLRHSTASLLLSLNISHKMVQELLGHSNIGITMDTYSHSMPGLQEEGIARLDTLLGG
ncbi:MAG: site-specific integrase [SAR202 cluster bacterium]|jgi:integrase|nr:site-specific integrase [SAR202 cluster bacterium]